MKLSELLAQIEPLPWVKYGNHPEFPGNSIWSKDVVVAIVPPDQHDKHASHTHYIAHAANMLPGIVEAMKEARTMAESLRKATGDALPGTICWTLSRAIEKAETVHLESDASSLNPDKV
jgi:hypothetical protein